jgi:hypothetical protein
VEIDNIIDNELYEKMSILKDEIEFFGTVDFIEKVDQNFIIYVDLFNQTTNDIDDQLLFNGKLKDVTYSFDLVIETTTLSILGHSNELFKFKVVKNKENYFDTFEGTISFLTNHIYDSINPFSFEKLDFKVSKATLDEKSKYKKRLENQLKHIEKFISIKEKYSIEDNKKKFNSKNSIQYRQYHVGLGSCSYINVGGISKGFFNIGYSNKKIGKTFPYSGFSKHKPDWVILSTINKDCYSAAIRYGNHQTFSCVWILPNVVKYNVNLIRLLYCIEIANGQLVMLKYKANSSVCSLIKDEIKLEVYYATEYNMNINGLSLYIENQDKFISFGNSDYNFLTKSLVKQNFDVIVIPYQGSKLKTKIHFNSNNQNTIDKHKNGFHIHRTDLSGNFYCQI